MSKQQPSALPATFLSGETNPSESVAQAQTPPKDEQIKYTISKYYQRFLKANMAVRPKHRMWQILDMFDRGEQWKNQNIPPWVPKPVTNLIRQVRTVKRANLASAISRPRFAPVVKKEEPLIYQLQLAHDHVWEESRVDRTIRRSIDRALLKGTSIAYVYNDETFVGGWYYGSSDPNSPDFNPEKAAQNQLFRGKIGVKRFPVENFFIDPDAYTIEDAKWVDITELLPLMEIRENPAFIKYCEKNGTIDKLKGLKTTQLEYDNDASGTIYERDYTPEEGQAIVPGDEMATLHTHWERYFKDGKWHLDATYYLRNTDFFLLRLTDIPVNEYPFAVLYDEEEDNDFWGTSTAMEILENQKILNKLDQTAAIIGVLHQNPQKIVYRESGINAQELARTGTLPGKVWTSNVPGEQAITLLKPMDIPKGLFDLSSVTMQNVKDMTGLNEAYMGQNAGSITTSTGVNDLIERATVRDKDKMLQIDAFVERISHLIVLNIIHNWGEPRPLMTPGPNGTPLYGTWNPKDFDKITKENLTWRVKSNIYAKAPVTQASRRQQANQMMQMQGQFQFQPAIITPQEWVKMQEFDDQENIIQRMNQDQQALQLQQQQNLAQQITQVATQIHALQSRGATADQIQQAAMQLAQQLQQQTTAQQSQNGMLNNQGPGSTPAAPQQAPQGVTGQVAMANMAKGSA